MIEMIKNILKEKKYGENLPRQDRYENIITKAIKQGVYKDNITEELNDFRTELKNVTINEAPKNDLVVLTLDEPNKRQEEPFGIEIIYYSPAIEKKEGKGVVILGLAGMKEIIDNKSLIFKCLKDAINESKEAEHN